MNLQEAYEARLKKSNDEYNKTLTTNKKWYEDNKERAKELQKQWRQNNPEKIEVYNAARRKSRKSSEEGE